MNVAFSTIRWLKTSCSRQRWSVVLAMGAFCAAALPEVCGHGAINERIAALTADLARSPDKAALHFQLAQAHAEHEDWVAAMRSLERARRAEAANW